MDVSLLKLKAIFRQAAGRKGTLLAQALRRSDARDAKCVGATVPDPSETSKSSGEPVRVREHSPRGDCGRVSPRSRLLSLRRSLGHCA